MLKKLFQLVAIIGIIIPIFMIIFLIKESYPAIAQYGLRAFLFQTEWFPIEGKVGLIYQTKGTLYCSFLSLFLAIPSAISFVFFTEFICPKKISFLLNLFCEVMMGIPSVIFGLWGLIKIVPLFALKYPPGTNMLVGAIILAMMIFPGLVVGLKGLLISFNQYYMASKLSLGISDLTYYLKIFLKGNIKKISTVSFIQLSRAMGETVAVLMVTGNVVQNPNSIFASMRTLTSNIALEMPYAEKLHRSTLFFSGLMLAFVLLLLTLFAQAVGNYQDD